MGINEKQEKSEREIEKKKNNGESGEMLSAANTIP